MTVDHRNQILSSASARIDSGLIALNEPTQFILRGVCSGMLLLAYHHEGPGARWSWLTFTYETLVREKGRLVA